MKISIAVLCFCLAYAIGLAPRQALADDPAPVTSAVDVKIEVDNDNPTHTVKGKGKWVRKATRLETPCTSNQTQTSIDITWGVDANQNPDPVTKGPITECDAKRSAIWKDFRTDNLEEGGKRFSFVTGNLSALAIAPGPPKGGTAESNVSIAINGKNQTGGGGVIASDKKPSENTAGGIGDLPKIESGFNDYRAYARERLAIAIISAGGPVDTVVTIVNKLSARGGAVALIDSLGMTLPDGSDTSSSFVLEVNHATDPTQEFFWSATVVDTVLYQEGVSVAGWIRIPGAWFLPDSTFPGEDVTYDVAPGDSFVVDLSVEAFDQIPVFTAVHGLQGLTALANMDHIEIRWHVQSHEEYLGFHIHRSESGGPFQQVTERRIPNDAFSYPTRFTWIDERVRAGDEYTYKIEVIHPDGTPEVWHETITVRVQAPLAFALRITGPNPVRFARGTEFAFDAPQSGADVSIVLYDIRGQRAAILVDGRVEAGTHIRSLGGSNLERLASGVYFLTMEAGSYHETKRIVLLK